MKHRKCAVNKTCLELFINPSSIGSNYFGCFGTLINDMQILVALPEECSSAKCRNQL